MPASAKVQELIDRRASLIARLDPEIIYDVWTVDVGEGEERVHIRARLGANRRTSYALVGAQRSDADTIEIEMARKQARSVLFEDVFNHEKCSIWHITEAEGL